MINDFFLYKLTILCSQETVSGHLFHFYNFLKGHMKIHQGKDTPEIFKKDCDALLKLCA